MKISVLFYVVLTTFWLVVLTVMAAMGLPFNWAFYLTCLGQVLVVVMVYKVLKDKYTTDKTFDDFYEDRPIKN